jgi:DNA-binding transcriptional ArsR family regulator
LIRKPEVDLIYHAIANTTRREILNYLKDGPKPVSEIADRFTVSQPAISQQLGILLKACLVRAETRGRQRLYEATPNPLREVRNWISRAVADPAGHVIVFRGKRQTVESD